MLTQKLWEQDSPAATLANYARKNKIAIGAIIASSKHRKACGIEWIGSGDRLAMICNMAQQILEARKEYKRDPAAWEKKARDDARPYHFTPTPIVRKPRKRWQGLGPYDLLRWMGLQDWSLEKCRKALRNLNFEEQRTKGLTRQHYQAGQNWDDSLGKIPTLTKEQVKELESLAFPVICYLTIRR